MLRKLSLFVLCAVMVCFNAGCVSSLMGNSSKLTEENAQKQVIRGKTTQQEVRDFFGEPTRVMKYKGGEEWSYLEAPTDEESSEASTYNMLGHTAVDIGATKAGTEVGKSHGAAAGVATQRGAGAVGHTAEDATTGEPATKALIINFDKKGIVKDYRLR